MKELEQKEYVTDKELKNFYDQCAKNAYIPENYQKAIEIGKMIKNRSTNKFKILKLGKIKLAETYQELVHNTNPTNRKKALRIADVAKQHKIPLFLKNKK